MSLVFSLPSLCALAQQEPPPGVADIAAMAGPDRTEKLVAGARREGSLTLFTSAANEDINIVAAAFTSLYGVKVEVWRAGNEDIVQRAIVENRSSRFDSDLFEMDAVGLETLRRENLLQPVTSPVLADLMPQAVKAGAWIGTRLNIITAAYNIDLVRAEELPHAFEDLQDVKWKNKLGVEANDSDWFSTIVNSRGEEAGLAMFRNIVAANGMSVRTSHSLMANLVASGEIPLALTAFRYKVNQMRSAGSPIAALPLLPNVARVNGIGLSPHAPHPYAALLFFDFMLTQGQSLLAAREVFPTNEKVRRLPGGMELAFVDPALVLDEGEKWRKLFNEIMLRQPR